LRHLLIAGLLILPACVEPGAPTETTSGGDPELAARRERRGDDDDRSGARVPFDDAEVFFEFNTTANDLGLQVFLDAEGWKRVAISDPARREIVEIMADGPLAQLGITELRFESAEPSPADVLAMFGPGDYSFRGRTAEGERLVAEATLSHEFLPAPTFAPTGGQLVDPSSTVVTWSAPGADRVEVILEDAELGHVFDVTVAGTITSLDVPPQFLRPGREYKIEILAIGENRNRTIAEGTFRTP
jgi:hypothetical protein